MHGSFRYAAYGLRIVSDLRLPLPAPVGVDSWPEVAIRRSWRPPVNLTEQLDAELLSAWGGKTPRTRYERWRLGSSALDDTLFRLGSAGSALVRHRDREILVWIPSAAKKGEMAVNLMGVVLSDAASALGAYCLHASAVELHGRAVLFLGPSGVGKSTTAMTLAMKGLRLLTDDVAALWPVQQGWVLRTGPEYLRVSPHAYSKLQRLATHGKATWKVPLAAPGKQLYQRRREPARTKDVPLGALIFLGEKMRARGQAWLRSLDAVEAIDRILTESRDFDPRNRVQFRARFASAGGMARSTPIWSFCGPRRLISLQRLLPLIEARLEGKLK